jgi:hypothetical protein
VVDGILTKNPRQRTGNECHAAGNTSANLFFGPWNLSSNLRWRHSIESCWVLLGLLTFGNIAACYSCWASSSSVATRVVSATNYHNSSEWCQSCQSHNSLLLIPHVVDRVSLTTQTVHGLCELPVVEAVGWRLEYCRFY